MVDHEKTTAVSEDVSVVEIVVAVDHLDVGTTQTELVAESKGPLGVLNWG